MPKEVVQYPATDGFSGTELSVHWSKEDAAAYGDREVQIGLTRHVWGQWQPDPDALVSTPPRHADHSHCSECALAVEENEQRKAAGYLPIMQADFTEAPPISEFDGPATVFASLSRRQINNLIKVLRRARDQAYGEDA